MTGLRRPILKLLILCLLLAALGIAPGSMRTAEAQICFWAIYEEYFDAAGNQCGVYNSCTGERQFCPNGYAWRTQEIFPCCR